METKKESLEPYRGEEMLHVQKQITKVRARGRMGWSHSKLVGALSQECVHKTGSEDR